MVEGDDGHAFIDLIDGDEHAIEVCGALWKSSAFRECGNGDGVADCGAEAAAVELEGCLWEGFRHVG